MRTQVLRLLEKIKRQDRGEEEMPPVTLPPLPQDERAERLERLANEAKAAKARKQDANDGFLDLHTAHGSEGFLDEDDSAEDENDDDFDVVDAYLGKIPNLFFCSEPFLSRWKCLPSGPGE